MKKLSLTVLRNSAFGVAAQVTIKVLSFGFSVLIVRRLGAQVFGQYATVTAFAALFLFIADLDLSPYPSYGGELARPQFEKWETY